MIAIAAGQDPRADIKKIGGNANVVKKAVARAIHIGHFSGMTPVALDLILVPTFNNG